MKAGKINLRVPYGTALHDREEEKRVLSVLREHRTIMGRETKAFEESVKNYFGKKYGLMVNSGSSANLLAIELLNAKEGDEVITPILTFSTTVAPLVMKGLVPVFTDVIGGKYIMDVNQIERLITKKTKAIMVPLLLGNVPDVKRIYSIAKKNRLIVIQDSCDTFGAKVNNVPVGKYADIISTSFYGSHIITAGGNGGMILVDKKGLADDLKMLRGWGRGSSTMNETEDIDLRYKSKINNNYYDAKFIFNKIGYNFLPNEMGAAFGNAQLLKLDKFKKTRERNFKILMQFFSKFEDIFILPDKDSDIETQWLAFPLTIKKEAMFTRQQIVTFLEKNNIQTRPIFTGNILFQPGFKNIKSRGIGKYPVANQIMQNGFLIGCHHGLMLKHISKITNKVEEFLSKRSS